MSQLRFLYDRNFSSRKYAGKSDKSPFASVQFLKKVEEQRILANITDWSIPQTSVGFGIWTTYQADKTMYLGQHNPIYPDGSVDPHFPDHSPKEVNAKKLSCKIYEEYTNRIEQECYQHMALFKVDVTDDVGEDLAVVASNVYNSLQKSENAIRRLQETKLLILSDLPEPAICHLKVQNLLDSLDMVSDTVGFVRLLSLMDLILATAVSALSNTTGILRSPSYPPPSVYMLIVATLRATHKTIELASVRSDLEEWKALITADPARAVTWNQGKRNLIRSLEALTAPRVSQSLPQQVAVNSVNKTLLLANDGEDSIVIDQQQYMAFLAFKLNNPSNICNLSNQRGRTVPASEIVGKVPPFDMVGPFPTDRSRSRDKDSPGTSRGASPGRGASPNRGQQVYGGVADFCVKFQTGECTRGTNCRWKHSIAPTGWKPPSN